MDRRWLWGAFARLVFSLVCAGILYTLWLAVFLLSARVGNRFLEVLGWLLAPLATAIGFAAGTATLERLTTIRRAGFFRILIWPLMGCAIGAGVVFWFGPMLIVFGMFAAGTASCALREALLGIKKDVA